MITYTDLIAIVGHHDHLHRDDMDAIVYYAGQAQDRILEIGAGQGAVTILLLLASQKHRVYSVSPFLRPGPSWRACMANVIQAIEHENRLDIADRFTLIVEPDDVLCEKWVVPLHLLVLGDGVMSKQQILGALSRWWPHLQVGSYILLRHSCHPLTPDVDGYDHGWVAPSVVAERLAGVDTVELVARQHALTVWRKLEE